MSLFDLFKRKKVTKTPALIISNALKSKGITATLSEINGEIESISKELAFKTCLPEELNLSYSAELQNTGTGYTIFVSMALAQGAGSIPQNILNTIYSLAIYYAVTSKIAENKGYSDFVIKPGQRLALCDFGGTGMQSSVKGHPIYALFPELINKTVLTVLFV